MRSHTHPGHAALYAGPHTPRPRSLHRTLLMMTFSRTERCRGVSACPWTICITLSIWAESEASSRPREELKGGPRCRQGGGGEGGGVTATTLKTHDLQECRSWRSSVLVVPASCRLLQQFAEGGLSVKPSCTKGKAVGV